MKSDEEDSFSRATELAYIQTGKPISVFPIGGGIRMSKNQERTATALVNGWTQRIKRQGGQMVVIPALTW